MSIYNPLSSSISPSLFLSYTDFQVTSSIPVSSSERTPTSSAVLVSESVFLLSASAAYTAGLNVQTSVNLNSYVYAVASSDPTDISSSLFDVEIPGYSAIGDNATTNNPPQYVEGPIRITTGKRVIYRHLVQTQLLLIMTLMQMLIMEVVYYLFMVVQTLIQLIIIL